MGKYKGELNWYWSKRVYVYPFKDLLQDFSWSEWRNINDSEFENRLNEYNEVEAIGLKLVTGKKGVCGIGIRRSTDDQHSLSVLQTSLSLLGLSKDYDWIIQTPHEYIIIIDAVDGFNNKDQKVFDNIRIYWETSIQTPIRGFPTAYPVQFIGFSPQSHPKQISKKNIYYCIDQLTEKVDIVLSKKKPWWKRLFC